MYDNIIVGYDGTEFSRAALRESASWIKRHGGKVTIVHGVYFDQEEFGIAPVQLEKRFEFGRNVCFTARDETMAEYGIEAESLVCEGEPPEVILDVARGKDANLIALGTYGKQGLKRLILGSVTNRVVLDSPCDVLAVKRSINGIEAESYKKILVPFDGSQFSKKALDRACGLSKVDGGAVTVLYVIPRYEEMMGFYKTASISENMMREARKVLDVATGITKAHGIDAATDIKEGSTPDMITETAQGLGSDIIVMGSHGWRGINRMVMGSTTERVIMTAHCPVLIAR